MKSKLRVSGNELRIEERSTDCKDSKSDKSIPEAKPQEENEEDLDHANKRLEFRELDPVLVELGSNRKNRPENRKNVDNDEENMEVEIDSEMKMLEGEMMNLNISRDD